MRAQPSPGVTIAVRLGCLLLLVPGIALAVVTFEHTWFFEPGNNATRTVHQTADRGYIIAADLRATIGHPACVSGLIRTDSLGDTLWAHYYQPDTGEGSPGAVGCIAGDGGYYLCAGRAGVGIGDIWVIKTDKFGDTVWTYVYEGPGLDFAEAVAPTADGGCIVAGKLTTETEAGMGMLKLDANGDTGWARLYHPEETYWGAAITQTHDGGYAVFGWGSASGDSEPTWLVRTDSLGDILWTLCHRCTPGGRWDHALGMCQTADHGFILSGEYATDTLIPSGTFLLKTDSLGTIEWKQLYPMTGYTASIFRCVKQTRDLGYVACGEYAWGTVHVYDSAGLGLWRFDSLGYVQWFRHFDGVTPERYSEVGWWVEQTHDDGFIVCGTDGGSGLDPDHVYLIKTDTLGLVYSGVEETADRRPHPVWLRVRPNPVARSAVIRYAGPMADKAHAAVYDVGGRQVALLDDALPVAGGVEFRWTGQDDAGRNLPGGVYFVHVRAGSNRATRSVTLAR